MHIDCADIAILFVYLFAFGRYQALVLLVFVEDIAAAHVAALDAKVSAGVYNLGSNQGISNLEIIEAAQRITKQILNFRSGPKRVGDPAMLTASSEKFDQYGSWRKYSLDHMIQHAWNWYV